MDSVLAYPSASHNYQIAGTDLLCVGFFAEYSGRHNATGSAIYKGFPQVSLVKNDASVYCGNAAFVAAMLNPFSHPFIYSSGVKHSRWKLFGIIGRGKTEDIGIEDQSCALA